MDLRELAVRYAWTLLSRNSPYAWAGDDPMRGWDCSGSFNEVLRAVGILPHEKGHGPSSSMLFGMFPPVDGPGPGVGAFWHAPRQPALIVHVALCIDGRHVIEWGGGDRGTQELEDAIRDNAFGRIRPISYRSNLAGFRDPFLNIG